jgi:hypothetical protein
MPSPFKEKKIVELNMIKLCLIPKTPQEILQQNLQLCNVFVTFAS